MVSVTEMIISKAQTITCEPEIIILHSEMIIAEIEQIIAKAPMIICKPEIITSHSEIIVATSK